MPLIVKINVALRKHFCQKIGSERVKTFILLVVFAGKVFQQIIGIPIGTNCVPLLADIFLYSYKAEFIQSLLSSGKKRLPSQFNFTYRATSSGTKVRTIVTKVKVAP